MIRRLLVANRGEIAVRVIRGARRMGIGTVAVYSDADARSQHVADADTALRIGPAPAAESYLNAGAILEAAQRSGADAIHPGYGFLSENADFAQAAIDAGLTWVGPPPEAMRALGDKARARALAERNGVPVLTGYQGDDQRVETLRAHADRIGYPVLIKAAAGGGGRGMRVVETAGEFSAQLEGAQREARAAFGDDRVLLERYVARPRHVEVQILGDAHGHVVHLGERECSVQRRHQKLIEESPSPAVDAALRERMGAAALRLARAAGYANAGTVEFLVLPNGEFAFLEVNARLQVEHPVTELVTGLDLVELQLRVASGEPLRLAQADVRLSGHAIEVRVVAEDPLADWLPSSGTLEACVLPTAVRVDTWVADGATVSPYYDSLLAKVIAHGQTRDAALADLKDALRRTWIDGVATNLDVLLATLEEPAFAEGALHTSFLQEHAIVQRTAEASVVALAAASSLAESDDPWRSGNGWRIGGADYLAEWVRAGRLHAARLERDQLRAHGEVLALGRRRVVVLDGRSYRFERPKGPTLERAGRATGGGGLSAPMPARVAKVVVAPGDEVDQNQPLVVLEAMKMEHVIEAPHAGVVGQVCVAVGEQVSAGTQLVVLE